MSTRPFKSGLSTIIRLSKRPGRKSAGSSTSGRLVAASNSRPLFVSNPSISARSWFSVCSRSSLLPMALSRLLPIASISSINTIHGAICCACLNRSRTRDAPTPHTSLQTQNLKGEERHLRFSCNCFGKQRLTCSRRSHQQAHLWQFCSDSGIFARIMQKIYDFLQGFFASSSPATSWNVTPVCFSTYTLALLFPIPIIPLPFDILFITKFIKKEYQDQRKDRRDKYSRISAKTSYPVYSVHTLLPASYKRWESVSSFTAPV